MWCIEKSGKVQYRERFPDEFTGKQKILSVTIDGKDTARNRKLAGELLKDLAKKKLSGETNNNITLREAVELYYKDQSRTLSLSTAVRNHGTMNTICKIFGDDVLLNRINAAFVKKKFLETNDPNGTLKERTTRLKAFMRWCYKNDLVQSVAFLDKLETYDNREAKEKRMSKYLEQEELATLLSGMSVYTFRQLCKFQALSGMRVGECIALNISDVDLKNRVIHVTKTYDAINGIITDPKTLASNRDVYIQDELLELCKWINVSRNRYVLSTCDRTDYFFHGKNGKPVEYYTYNKYLKENSERILGKRVTTHVLRHTHVALMAEAGASLEAISKRCGHENSKITKDVYMHVTKKMQDKYNQEFKNIKIL